MQDAAIPTLDLSRERLAVAGTGELRFATQEERDGACVQLARAGHIVAELEGVGPSARGRLGEVIDAAIEEALAARGAAGPGITSGSDRDATLGDQLFRVRRSGGQGLAIILGPLRAAAGFRAALEPEDCATLRFLADATRERPVTLVLDARDAATGSYGNPVPLRSLLASPVAVVRTEVRAREPAPPVPTPTPISAVTSAPCIATPAAPAAIAPAIPVPLATPVALPVPTVTATPPVSAPSPAVRHTAGALVVEKEDPWRAWTLQLTAARGPQPLAMLEKLFTESYMPLANAIASGLDDARARHAHDEFAATFAKGYADAFPTFAATSKRPRMVFDVHDTAARIARLHGARSTRVLIVDAMRWDLARMIEERVVARLGVQASLTDELLFWSALPTTSVRQLETIARGIEALRSPAVLDPEAEPPRGRTAEFVRRMRVGPREIHKLDVVAARVQAARGRVLQELPEIAEVAAEAIARHAETCAPRTLLLVTGDHGFALDRTGSPRQGGASPEEVLVGAFALLVGDVH